MKLIRNKEEETGLSFILQTKKDSIGVNCENGDLQIFLSEQKKDTKGVFHWPGEYEMNGVSFFLSPLEGNQSIGRIFVEGVRIVLFKDSGLTAVDDELLALFGNVDVLLIEKSDDGLNKADMKKLLEKIDPRILIASQGKTAIALKEYSYPFVEEKSVNITKASLPSEVSEYIIL